MKIILLIIGTLILLGVTDLLLGAYYFAKYQSTVKETVSSYMDNLKSNNYQAAWDLQDDDAKSALPFNQFSKKIGDTVSYYGEIQTYSINRVEIGNKLSPSYIGPEATVYVTLQQSKITTTNKFNLILQGELWKIGLVQSYQTSNSPSPVSNNQSSQTAQTASQDPNSQILIPLEAKLNRSSPIKDSTTKWDQWVVSYQKLIPLTGKSFETSDSVDTSNFNPAKILASEKALEPTFDAYFTSLGFSKEQIYTQVNKDNSSRSDAPLLYGYTKDNIKCLISLNATTDPTLGTYFCGMVDQKQQALDEQFFPLIFSSQNEVPLTSDEAGVVYVDNISGNYAKGSNDRYLKGIYEPSGGAWIAARVNGQWKIIYIGQENPLCTVMNQYSVPITMYGKCN